MKNIFKILAKINKVLLPSLTKNRVDPIKATKFQILLLGWRYYITKNSLN
ncbi:MAG: SsrA-binding protein [Flavobacteriaceae bacterium]|nr:SsrA-binding protein [Flavobacteriaceae bacterium]MDC1459776.1 SsrA-binding protein [Flavobacteriaceae bacterium]MDC3221215.1 SsrA-binding protein [Flavobacteriaceae bacterium]MDG1343366.1 SsrA-binding protein [Flavobacteriaceae bacterium]MDG1791798.1 SsrA-binding protein [Flavobacteriaceae bacterium]